MRLKEKVTQREKEIKQAINANPNSRSAAPPKIIPSRTPSFVIAKETDLKRKMFPSCHINTTVPRDPFYNPPPFSRCDFDTQIPRYMLNASKIQDHKWKISAERQVGSWAQ